jgi:hypothetical protein
MVGRPRNVEELSKLVQVGHVLPVWVPVLCPRPKKHKHQSLSDSRPCVCVGIVADTTAHLLSYVGASTR